MATAICGAKQGASNIDASYIETIDKNNPVNIEGYAEHIYNYHKQFNGGN